MRHSDNRDSRACKGMENCTDCTGRNHKTVKGKNVINCMLCYREEIVTKQEQEQRIYADP